MIQSTLFANNVQLECMELDFFVHTSTQTGNHFRSSDLRIINEIFGLLIITPFVIFGSSQPVG